MASEPHQKSRQRFGAARQAELRSLRQLAERLEHSAQIARCGDNTSAGEMAALSLGRDAAAVRWALLNLDPSLEGPRQTLSALHL